MAASSVLIAQPPQGPTFRAGTQVVSLFVGNPDLMTRQREAATDDGELLRVTDRHFCRQSATGDVVGGEVFD